MSATNGPSTRKMVHTCGLLIANLIFGAPLASRQHWDALAARQPHHATWRARRRFRIVSAGSDSFLPLPLHSRLRYSAPPYTSALHPSPLMLLHHRIAPLLGALV